MPKRLIKFNLDFDKKDILQKFSIKQFDNAIIEISTFKNNVEYNPTGSTCKLYVGISNDAFKQEANIQVQENKIVIDLDKNIIAKNGRAYAELELTDRQGVETSSTFIFTVETKLGEGATVPGNIEGFVAKYERLIKEFKTQVDNTVNDCNTRVDNKLIQLQSDYDNTKNEVVVKTDNKISEVEKRFNQLTTSQQQDSEVIDARDGEESLNERLKRDLVYEDGSNVKDKIKDIEGLKELQNLKYVTNKGYLVCEDTKNGVIDKMKIKGRTLVNLSNSTRTSTGNGATYDGNVITLPKSGYVSFLCTDRQGLQGKTLTVKYHAPLEVGDSQLRASIRYKDAENVIQNITTYSYDSKIKFTVPDTVYKAIYIYINNSKDDVVTQEYKITCVQGDDLESNNEHFEGLASVGDGVDKLEVLSCKSDGNLVDFNDPFTTTNVSTRTKAYSAYIPKDVEKLYCKVFLDDDTELNNGNIELQFRMEDDTSIINKPVNSPYFTFTKGLLNNCKKIGFYYNSNFGVKTISKLIISTTPMPYQPLNQHKKQILYYDPANQTWKKPILREWDTIEQHSDVKWYYHKCSGEKVLNGSEEGISVYAEKNNTITFTIPCSDIFLSREQTVISDKFSYLYSGFSSSYDVESISNSVKYSNAYITISKTKLETQDVAGFKKWLQDNPVTVVYQLAPEVYECTPLNLNSYENEMMVQFIGGAINPGLEFEVTSHIGNMVLGNRDRINYLEDKFIESLRQVLAGDMQSLAYMLYPEDFIIEDVPTLIPELY